MRYRAITPGCHVALGADGSLVLVWRMPDIIRALKTNNFYAHRSSIYSKALACGWPHCWHDLRSWYQGDGLDASGKGVRLRNNIMSAYLY